MKENLFRGKTTDGRWVYGSLILADTYCCILELEENIHPMDYPYLDDDIGWIDGKATPVIPETVGQFIGLSDRNGSKMFEGDIFLYNNEYRYEVYWCDERKGFYARNQFLPDDDYVGNYYENCIENIGNVYDNPELLEVVRK